MHVEMPSAEMSSVPFLQSGMPGHRVLVNAAGRLRIVHRSNAGAPGVNSCDDQTPDHFQKVCRS